MRRPAPSALRLLLLTLACVSLPAAGPSAAQALPAEGLSPATRAELAGVLAHPKLRDGRRGAIVVRLGHGAAGPEGFALLPGPPEPAAELFTHHAGTPLTPASSLKLFTSAAALHFLGPQHRFSTRVVAPSPPADGVVEALYLVGGGDPSLDYAGLERLADTVRAAGITRVAGAVYGDATRYRDPIAYGWTEDDQLWYYGAEAKALTLARNHVDVTVAPGPAPGAPGRVTFAPDNRYVVVRNRTVTNASGGGTSIRFSRRLGRREIVVSGRIALDRAPLSEGLAVHRVEHYAATVFAGMLKDRGIAVEALPAVRGAPLGAVLLAELESPPLAELLQRLLKRSDNLYAELLLRELGYAATGVGSTRAGVDQVYAFLTAHHLPLSGLRVYDGSGLSRHDRVTPRSLAGVLRVMASHAHGAPFIAALPIAGVDGTLRTRMRDSVAAGRVRAKTGTLTGRTSLSGYVPTLDGRLLAAVTMFDGVSATSTEARALHDAFFVALASED